MIHSALTVCGARLVVHYLHGPTFPTGDAEALSSMCRAHGAEIRFHTIADEQVAGLPVENRFGAAMWYRILLPELLADLERILYLDVDTLVVDELDALLALDLGDHYLAAVTNVFMEFHRYRYEQLAMPPEDYFNSGVLLLNLDVMRRSRFRERLCELVATAGAGFEWPDQDALNLTVAGRWARLHPRFNCMNSLHTRPRLAREVFGEPAFSQALKRPAVRHFEGSGSNKPWHALHPREGRALYRTHRRATPWPDYRLQEATPLNRVRRAVMDVPRLTRGLSGTGRR